MTDFFISAKNIVLAGVKVRDSCVFVGQIPKFGVCSVSQSTILVPQHGWTCLHSSSSVRRTLGKAETGKSNVCDYLDLPSKGSSEG